MAAASHERDQFSLALLLDMLTPLSFDDLAYEDLGSRQGPLVNVFREHGTRLRAFNETI